MANFSSRDCARPDAADGHRLRPGLCAGAGRIGLGGIHFGEHADAHWAILLTLFTASIAVPLNTAFGIAAAWAITKFDFRGKNILITLIDLPLAVSPVISGMILVLLFGAQGILGAWLQRHDIRII